MGWFNFLNTKSLNPTIPANERPHYIIKSIEDFTAKLYDNSATNIFGDYSDGVRLQLILGYLEAIDRDPAIAKNDPTTSKLVVSYYHLKHWANETPNLSDLLSIIKSSQKIELMEMDLDRSISNINRAATETYGCIRSACLGINSKYPIFLPYPLLEKKLLALDLVYTSSIVIKDVVGRVYGSQLLIKEAKELWDEHLKRRIELAELNKTLDNDSR